MDIKALLSEFGDFGDFFENDALPFGEVIPAFCYLSEIMKQLLLVLSMLVNDIPEGGWCLAFRFLPCLIVFLSYCLWCLILI